MNTLPRLIRAIVIVLLTVGIGTTVFAEPARAQAADCVVDTVAPSLDNARIDFKSLNYRCAILKTEAVLKKPNLTSDEKANAHILMAEIYYMTKEMTPDGREKCKEHLRQAYKAIYKWSGHLDVGDQEFIQMMTDANREVYGQPSMTAPLIGSGILAVSATAFAATAMRASDKWNNYEQSTLRPSDMYDSYKKAAQLRNAMLYVGGAALLVSGGLWVKYFKDRGEKSPQGPDGMQSRRLTISPLYAGLAVIYSF